MTPEHRDTLTVLLRSYRRGTNIHKALTAALAVPLGAANGAAVRDPTHEEHDALDGMDRVDYFRAGMRAAGAR